MRGRRRPIKNKSYTKENIFDFSQILRILKIIWKSSKGLTIARFSLLILQAVLPLIPLYLMKLLLDSFANPEIKPEFNYVLLILSGFAATKILSIIISNIQVYVNLLQTDIINDHMSNIVITKALNTDLEYFDSDVYHDIFQRAIMSSTSRPLQVLNTITQLVQNCVMLFGILIVLFELHWGIVLILIFIAIPVALIRWHFTNKTVDLREAQTQKERRSGYFKQILTSALYAKEVRIFAYGKSLLDRFLALRWDLRLEKRLLHLRQTRTIGLAQSAEAIAIIAALSFIALQAIEGHLTVGDIAMYYGLFQKAQGNIASVLRSGVSLHENRRYLEHLFLFMDLKKKIANPRSPIQITEKVNKISFKEVDFTYPKTKKQILQKVSWEANQGEIIAIVGENGSGKTTMAKLLTRLYDRDSGGIYINGTDIKSIDLKDLRTKMTVINQDFAKYNATVSENIQFADVHKELDLDQIIDASKLAKAEKFIEALDLEYEAQLGRSFHAGEELSGGQWQKIALARAFYKSADIIILDEPTSFIDPIAEEEIFSNLRQIVQDKILVLITHRIYNLRMADKIIVMDKGSVVEMGNHTELMALNGLYREMFDKQS